MTNLYNFMDGADGLAGLMAMIGFGAYAAGAAAAGAWALAATACTIASAAAGFLAFNWPPARVFLGDAGSIPLGFLAGVLGLHGVATGTWPLWFPALVFSPFIVDATFTLLRRALRRERVWTAHREHLYQRLVLCGWAPRELAGASAALMLGVAVSALLALRSGEMLRCGIIVAWTLLYLLLLAGAAFRTPHNKTNESARHGPTGTQGEHR